MPGRSLFGPLRFREHPGGVPTTSGAGVPNLSGAPTGDDDSGAGVVGPRLEENRSRDRRHDWRRRRYRRDLRRQEGRAYWSGDRRRCELDLRSAEALAARSRLVARARGSRMSSPRPEHRVTISTTEDTATNEGH